MDCDAPISPRSRRCKSCVAKNRWALAEENGLKGKRRGVPAGTKYPPAICKRCGQPFPYSSRTVYCSDECQSSVVTKTCAGCGAEFKIPKSNEQRYTYCARECSMAHRGETVACERCGQPFRNGVASHRRRFCCESCRRPPVLVSCEECSAEFRVTPSRQLRGRRFCSTRCYRASNAETSLERTVRLTLERFGLDADTQVQVGPWVVDFQLGELIIEADGVYWHAQRPDVDRRKTADLESRGFAVWRLSEDEIKAPDFPDVLERRLHRRGIV